MGESDAARVDVMAVVDAARRYDAVADMIEAAVSAHQAQTAFDGALAGRSHVAQGDALRNAMALLVDQMRTWSRACAEIASALRVSADAYAGVEAVGARRLG